jgi:hypothetical protein
MSMRLTFLAAAALALVCSAAAFDEADALFGNVKALCGQAFAGRLVSTDARDADMAGKPLVMHVASCDGDRVAIPFQVGDDRSRTWLITRTDKGLRLKHRHRHADGTDDKVTLYGGDTATPGTATRQEFPVDAESQAMFRANGLDVSVTNVWALELEPGRMFAYELRREGRFFRVEFDLGKPVATPPPPWGAAE